MSDFDFDLLTIGAGSGGVAASRRAAALGARVGLIEDDRVGGTCVLRGCVPKKLMVYASGYASSLVDAMGFGWEIGEHSIDWARLVEAKDRELARLNGIYLRMLETSGVTLIRGRGSLVGPHEVQVGDDRYTARHILLATGGRPSVPDFPGSELTMTSDEILAHTSLPQRMLVIGGGYIGVEFACIFGQVGVHVTQVVRGDGILRGFDEDVRSHLTEEMSNAGIDVRAQTQVAAIERTDQRLAVTLHSGEVLSADVVLAATGRLPNTAGLGLEAAGVTSGARGEVLVDRRNQTNVSSIYAVGDVTDRVNLTPVAIADGRGLAETLFGGIDVEIDHAGIPTAVFSQPEVGTVGMTEAEARAQCDEVRVFETKFRPMRHTMTGRASRVMMKLLVDGATDRVVGCHMVGDDAAEIVQAV
ncbi:MAG: glutathione-disulfide reductase, partial [Nannocystaceae bacterium]